ncbi:MAG: PAS domain S-box protein [Hyphomicrobiales bacterium]|nr:PAS domain S-box protein [Hyphomicrobiales bacterium]
MAFANLLSELAGARYTVGWAAARVSWVISACTVLAYLVGHLVRQHGMLRSTERHFQILVEGVRDYAIFMLDPTGHITSWNPGAEHIKGYRSEEIIGQHFSRFYTPADRAADVPGHALREAAEKGKYEAENWRVRKDGSTFFASVVIDAIRDRSGRLIGFAKVTRDITERRRAQEQLEEARVRLFQSQKMEAVGQLTGGVAHDFNNLLTIILGNLDIASRHVGSLSGGIADQLKRLLGNARTGAQRAATLTQRLLVFSRRQPLSPKVLDATRFITGAVEFLQRSLGERIHIQAAGSAGLWTIEADPHQLEAALLNLAVNARDAMPDGGKLSLGASNVVVDESYSRANPEIAPGQYVVISVTDTGTGMSPETVARAFEPFFTTKEVGQGTGLGLSQVYGFVKQSGGHVKVYSEVGYGTTVKIYLPRFVGVDGAQEADAPAPPGISLGETILVVEDDPDVRSYVVEALRALDYNVLEAGEARAAITAVEQRDGEIDLVLSDVILPGKNGRELVRELHARWPALRVLYMTGYSRDAIVHQGRLDPGVEVIQKPLVHAELADRIRTILER